MSDFITPAEAKARGFDPATVSQYETIERAREEALQLIPEIEVAFEGVPRPQTTLSVAKGYDDEWDLSAERIEELRSRDPESVWQDVPDQSMEARQEYFTFSDPPGWLFYLPAFMCHYLRNFPDDGWDAVYQACQRKTHFDLLNEAQIQCVDSFLELCGRHQLRR
ncbi:DUF6714 family protein [Haloferula rosea]|uniref:Uncharacterized protein n=1 Tax=Haloferula rosea TaxID=490093 RepID=A0A934RGY6_9BACT|nr:DUF6714 family protein [Haloferula rosea]MBK1829031.1 hypothetical protein [Haloferula rosea]